MIGVNYPLADLVVSMLYLALIVFWLMLAFHVMVDLFRSHDLSGGAKALWVLFILILPLAGTLIYLVARGGAMHERDQRAVRDQQRALEDYIRSIAHSKE
ncbi:MAG: PLDc N-terminal domain-containing protein [Acidimicrobiales bacterium]